MLTVLLASRSHQDTALFQYPLWELHLGRCAGYCKLVHVDRSLSPMESVKLGCRLGHRGRGIEGEGGGEEE